MKIETIQEITVKEGETLENLVDSINRIIRATNTLSSKGIDLSFNLRADVVTVTTGTGLNKNGAWVLRNNFYPSVPKAVFIGKFLPQNVKANYFTDPGFTPTIWWDIGSGNSTIEVTCTSPSSSTNKAAITLIILY